jgi:hypothetical protein
MAIYEIVSVLAFLGALGWAINSRNPFNLGAVLGGFFLFVFDWIWCGKWFFNATFTGDLTMIPGIHILGQQYPIAVACNWSVGFGLMPLLLSRFHGALSAKLGVLHFPVVFAVAAVLDMLAEVPLVSGLGVYTYHQAPQYLLWGVTWSNLWLGAGILALPYFGFAYVQKWAAIPPNAGFALNSETTWKGILMAAATLWASFFIMGVPQIFWYSAVAPWVESGRLF